MVTLFVLHKTLLCRKKKKKLEMMNQMQAKGSEITSKEQEFDI